MDANQTTDGELEMLLIKTVQGHASPVSCTLVGGKLVQSDDVIPQLTKPNLALLALYLRTASSISDQLHDWVVSLFLPTRPASSSRHFCPWKEEPDGQTSANEETGTEEDCKLKGQRYDFQDISTACRVKEIKRRGQGNPKNARYAHWTESLPVDTRQRMEAIKEKLSGTVEIDEFTLLYLTLRDRPLGVEDRTWLANVFDPASSFDFHIKKIWRRQAGPKPGHETLSLLMREVATEIEEHLANDRLLAPSKRKGFKNIVPDAAARHGKSKGLGALALNLKRIIEGKNDG